MDRIEYRDVVDKSSWPERGVWDNEPDKIQWQDQETGLPCLIVRGPVGALCGYVGVAPGHPLYGESYADDPLENVDVHGGLTFASPCMEVANEAIGVCHKPGEGEPDHVWWFGFDCAHAWDITPSYDAPYGLRGERVYRDVAYVENEVRSLARQLKAVSP